MRTYGTVRWKKGSWVVDCEPHVMLRLKRVFAQVSRKHAGELTITDTPATSRDLEWFLQRYPMDVEDAARLERRAREHDQAVSTVQRILMRTSEPQAFELAIPARRYQRDAAEICLATGRLLLADDVGLGKTCSAICVISDPRARPAVVVTLTHLPSQWRAQVEKFAPGLRVLVAKKGQPTKSDLEAIGGLLPPEVIVLSYSKLAGWGDTLAKVVQPRCVVFDEIQELRTGDGSNKGAAAYEVAKVASYRLGLSATPIYNYGGEIWNVLEPLEHAALGTRSEFEQEWCSGAREGKNAKLKDPKVFGTYLRDRGLMIRRTGFDVRDEVPELAQPIRIPHVVDSDTKVIEDAQSSAAELARIILAGTANQQERFAAEQEIDAKMRQATGIAKAPYVAAFVKMLLDGDDEAKVLLYGWHHAVYALWKEALWEYQPTFYTGKETVAEKEAAKQAFLEGDSRVLVMSLRAGAGLDGLQEKCRFVVFGELDWSPGVHDQCVGRVHRPGQRETVCAYFLHTESGADPLMVEVLGVKKAQVAGIRDPAGALLERVGDPHEHVRKLAELCLQRGRSPAPMEEAVA